VLFKVVKGALDVPIVGVVSDGHLIRNAVETALPGAAHGLCHFHYQSMKPRNRFTADRHAKKKNSKAGAGVRAIERFRRRSAHHRGCSRLLSWYGQL